MRDLYDILDVPKGASDEDIKRAYRRKARELHPDAGGGDDEGFKELTAAYEVLRNPQAKANYDAYGDPRGPGGMGGATDFGGFGDLSDLINSFFGGAGFGGAAGARTSRAGRDALVDVVLSLEDAFSGVSRDVDVSVQRTCDVCSGSGARGGSGPTTCATCGGAGAVQQVRNSVFGQVLTSGTCATCRGSGTTIADPCPACAGEGRRRISESITVDVPPGVDDGTRLRLVGRGEAGRNNGQAGDLFVRVRVRPHELFTREGNDLHCELRIPMVQAALGAKLSLPTFEGDQAVEVPAGTQSGDVITLRRQGMPKLSGGGARGNLSVHCRVQTPTDLDDEQRTLLRRLAEERGETAAEASSQRSLFHRLRDALGA